MTDTAPYCAVYDFELVPYALGDVLTWNVQSSIQCIEAGRDKVDVYICVDPRFPSSIYQRELVTTDNSFLFFNELLGAFGTHPQLGDLHIFEDRDRLIARLKEVAKGDPVNEVVLKDYLNVLGQRDDLDALVAYFIKYVYSHERINAFAEQKGRIPLLAASRGCSPDVEGLLTHALGGKRTVIIHPRMRRLDAGYGGHHTYSRDSDFLEWYEFVRTAGTNYPEVQFVVVGRLQEKPLELLRLPNVMSLRTLGLGLGHELTLLRLADLFIGTSSGFAAMANFCETPYFITHMNKESCKAYAIEDGAKRLPFAAPNQELVYEPETTALLLSLLERGLALPPRGKPSSGRNPLEGLDVAAYERTRGSFLVPSASTSRFSIDDAQADIETAFLVRPRIEQAIIDISRSYYREGKTVGKRIARNFPRLVKGFGELATLNSSRRPPLREYLPVVTRRALLSISGNIMPRWMHGTIIHRAFRRAKDMITGYERR